VIIFGSVRFLSKKVTKPKFFFLKKKLKSGQTDRFRFGSVQFLGKKPVQTGLARFFFWFFFCFSSVRFFRFFAYKTETEPADFFKILIGFFFQFGFFGYCFSGFLGLIGFSVFLLTPSKEEIN
jgi:hypothetical protein